MAIRRMLYTRKNMQEVLEKIKEAIEVCLEADKEEINTEKIFIAEL